jgi:hypothetical protein
MKSGLTYIIFVIDRSGSMQSICSDMIGGFNTFIKSQQDAKLGQCRVFAYKFDTQYETMFEDVDLYQVPLLDKNNYIPRGGTALYDSLGKTINDMGARLSAMPEEERPEKVLVVTITDGEDNDHLHNRDAVRMDSIMVKGMVEHQTKVYSWDFAYIGANQDSWAVGSSMGYQAGTTLDYVADSAGTALAFDTLSRSATAYRSLKGASFKFMDTTDTAASKTKKKIPSKVV